MSIFEGRIGTTYTDNTGFTSKATYKNIYTGEKKELVVNTFTPNYGIAGGITMTTLKDVSGNVVSEKVWKPLAFDTSNIRLNATRQIEGVDLLIDSYEAIDVNTGYSMPHIQGDLTGDEYKAFLQKAKDNQSSYMGKETRYNLPLIIIVFLLILFLIKKLK